MMTMQSWFGVRFVLHWENQDSPNFTKFFFLLESIGLLDHPIYELKKTNTWSSSQSKRDPPSNYTWNKKIGIKINYLDL